jgi:hypothetical protein
VVLLHKQDRDGFIGKSGIGFLMSKADPSVIQGYFYNEYVSWFTVHCWYGIDPEGGLGSTWIANLQYVYLGSAAPLSSEERAEFLAKRNDRFLGE